MANQKANHPKRPMQYIAKSLPKKGKVKNGDHFGFYEDNRVQIVAVADGVGGKPCDWKASEQACEDLVSYKAPLGRLHTFEETELSAFVLSDEPDFV
jgi:serine/threonine protein phosphatase PrpC